MPTTHGCELNLIKFMVEAFFILQLHYRLEANWCQVILNQSGLQHCMKQPECFSLSTNAMISKRMCGD